MGESVTLSKPVTITLTPAAIQTILQGLEELPYKQSHPVIEYIIARCVEQAGKPDLP